MTCPMCQALCLLSDLTPDVVIRAVGGNEIRQRVCGSCVVEVKGNLVYSKVTRIVYPD